MRTPDHRQLASQRPRSQLPQDVQHHTLVLATDGAHRRLHLPYYPPVEEGFSASGSGQRGAVRTTITSVHSHRWAPPPARGLRGAVPGLHGPGAEIRAGSQIAAGEREQCRGEREGEHQRGVV